MRSRGFTLAEVVVALAVLALLLTFLAGVQRSTLRLEARAGEARLLGRRLASELRLQRELPGASCQAPGGLPPGWSCRLSRACLRAPPACAVQVVSIRLASADGRAVRGVTAVARTLQVLPVEAPP